MIMGPLLTIVHVLAAVLLLGPVTVAVSQFQVQALKAHEGDTSVPGPILLTGGVALFAAISVYLGS